MIARLVTSAVAVALTCHRDGPRAVFRAFRHHTAIQRGRRLLGRYKAALTADTHPAADRILASAEMALRAAKRLEVTK